MIDRGFRGYRGCKRWTACAAVGTSRRHQEMEMRILGLARISGGEGGGLKSHLPYFL
jgi:hypothetical protein